MYSRCLRRRAVSYTPLSLLRYRALISVGEVRRPQIGLHDERKALTSRRRSASATLVARASTSCRKTSLCEASCLLSISNASASCLAASFFFGSFSRGQQLVRTKRQSGLPVGCPLHGFLQGTENTTFCAHSCSHPLLSVLPSCLPGKRLPERFLRKPDFTQARLPLLDFGSQRVGCSLKKRQPYFASVSLVLRHRPFFIAFPRSINQALLLRR